MPIEATEVRRDSLRYTPRSSTEYNSERLPEPSAMSSMELRYRSDVKSGLISQHPLGLLAMISIGGVLVGLGSHLAPAFVSWVWQKLQETEGLTVVGSILSGLVLTFLSLLLVFVPKLIRRGLLLSMLPITAVSIGRWFGYFMEVSIIFGGLALWAGYAWRSYFLTFHHRWLSADPRMSTQDALMWHQVVRRWHPPTFSWAAQAIERYFSYEAVQGAPGVWIPPSSVSARLIPPALFCGTVFALSAFPIADAWPLQSQIVAGVLPAVILIGLFLWTAGEAVWLDLECDAGFKNDQRTAQEQHSDRVRHSQHLATDPVTKETVKEAEHLFLGMEPDEKFPVLLHRALLGEHVYVAGRTGSGKTSMALMSLLIQLIRGNYEPGGWSEKTPTVVIDLKGDPALFQTAKAEAEARGQKFRYFTIEAGKASYYFNPFVCFKSLTVTPSQMVQMVLDALGLFHGFEYAKGYFSECSRFMLAEALRNPTGVENFRDLHARLTTLYSQRPKDFEDSSLLRSVVESLTHYEQLITTSVDEQGDNTIRFDRLLEDREVVYFWLPTTKESISSAHIGRLILLCLRVAALDRQAAQKPKHQMVLLIDEFQKLSSEQFEHLLQQARSSGIGAILANQSLADLKTADRDLMQTVRTNTRVKLFFSVTEPDEIEAFRELSGEELQTFGENSMEAIRHRLGIKELASLSDHPKRLLCHVTSGSGYTQFGGFPIPAEADWPISKQLSDFRAAMPWPVAPVVVKRKPSQTPSKVASVGRNVVPITPLKAQPVAPIQPAPSVAASAVSPVVILKVPPQNTTAPPQPVSTHVTPSVAAQPIPVPQNAQFAAVAPVGTIQAPLVGRVGSKKSKKRKGNHPPLPVPRPTPSPTVKQAFANKILTLVQQ